jgi:hypothetical protein
MRHRTSTGPLLPSVLDLGGRDAEDVPDPALLPELIALGAALVFFGTFVTLGSELRFTITAPFFDF